MYLWKGLAAEIIAHGKKRRAQRLPFTSKQRPLPLLSRMSKLCFGHLKQKA